jgi:maltose/moltooligosaccharide transporter
LAILKADKGGFLSPFREIFMAIRDMPPLLWQLALVYLFQWYAMFCYWQYISHSIAFSVWNTSASADPGRYEEAVGWTGLVNGFYNIVTFLSAFALVGLAHRYSAKRVHVVSLLMASLSLFLLPGISDKYLLFLPMVGFGIAWASMMGVPYIMVVNAIPKERYGVYMGIVNMMIVIPMIIQTLTFGMIYEHILGAKPGNVMYFASALLLLASIATLRIRVPEVVEVGGPETGEGH